jgi:polar amino acid transport system substrate-binding protein
VTNYVSGSKKYELETLGEPLRRDKVAIAFRKADHALLKKVNGVLKDMHDDGSLKKISSKMIKNNY